MPDGGTSAGGRRIDLVSVDGPPDLPVEPSVEVVAPEATRSAPPRLRVTVTNAADFPVEVGEERDVVFAFVHSQERPGIQLLPGPADGYEPVRTGCWRLAEPIAIPEYYGIVRLAPGESTSREVGVWGGHELESGCLPTGRFRFLTAYTVARDAAEGLDDPEFTARWGFAIEIA